MIRPGRTGDLAQLLALSRKLRDESITMRDIAIDEPKLTVVYKRAFDPADEKVCVFVDERDGKIQAALLGFITEYYFSRETFATDLYLYVDPSLRRGLVSGVIARRLFERYRDWATAQNVREIRTGVTTGIAVDAAHRFYVAMGMSHIGGNYALPPTKV